MKAAIPLLIVFIFTVAILSFATSSPQQIIGRLSDVSARSLVLSPIDDSARPIRIAVTPATHFIQGGVVASASDLKPGSWIVVIARRNFGKTVALMVVIGKHHEQPGKKPMRSHAPASIAWG